MWFLSGMSKTFREWNVDQAFLLPPSVREFVPPDHLSHFVRDTVRDELDLSAIVDSYREERGYPPYHPAMMTALLLYAYSQGIYSSRRIARGCEERVDFMAVTGLQKPDFRTVNEFRRRHLEALKGLFVQVLRLCRAAGLARLGHVSLDGTKIHANASKHKAMSYGRMKQAEAELEAEVAQWLAAAETTDSAEDAEHGVERRGDEMPAWVADKAKRLERIRAAKAALEAEAQAEAAANKPRGDDADPPRPKRGPKPKTPPGTPKDTAQRNFTDPESRIMFSRHHGGFLQAYNAQAAVDVESQVIVARGLTNNASDVHQLIAIVQQIRENVGRQAKELSADAGYCDEKNLAALDRRRIRGYVATGRQRHGEADASGRRKIEPGTRIHRMWLRLKRAGHRSRYRLRKIGAEPVFGQIKYGRGFHRFLLRGVEKVAAEWSLVCTAHNLRKLALAVA